jgi:hypothetical protein
MEYRKKLLDNIKKVKLLDIDEEMKKELIRTLLEKTSNTEDYKEAKKEKIQKFRDTKKVRDDSEKIDEDLLIKENDNNNEELNGSNKQEKKNEFVKKYKREEEI